MTLRDVVLGVVFLILVLVVLYAFGVLPTSHPTGAADVWTSQA
jgi:hypothetical protein